MGPILLALISVIIISLISLVGMFALSINTNLLNRITFLLVSLAVGVLLGDVFLHILPEVFEEYNHGDLGLPLVVLAGILAFFVFEKLVHWHHHSVDKENHATVKAAGINNLVADGVHNFVDGLIIGAAFLVDPEIGVATAIAVALHEIPQEIADYGVLLHAGFSRQRALLFNFLSALTAILGLLFAVVLGDNVEGFANIMLVFAAGGFIYIAASDLIPELHKKSNWKHSLLQIVVITIGIVIMMGITLLEGETHSDSHSDTLQEHQEDANIHS